MATKTADLHIRIQPGLKKQAEEVFAETGHTMSEALEQILGWTVKHKKSPIRLRRRANIADFGKMTNCEVEQYLSDVSREADEDFKKGRTILSEDVRKAFHKEYGFKI